MRGALIGCGYFGQIQLEAWRRMSGVEIVAACDVSLDKAQAVSPQAYTDVEKLLQAQDLNFVDVATRPDTHVELVRAAVNHRIPAICQKPVAPSLAEAMELTAIAESAAIPVMIHENWRWQPWYREARRRIEAGDIGNPVSYHFRHRQRDGLGPNPYPNQPYFKDMPRLLIHETLVHYIDTARFLFGDIDGIYACTRRENLMIAGEDGALLMIDHRSGVTGVVDGNRYLNPARPGPAMGEALLEGDESWIRIEADGDLCLGTELVWQNDATTGYKGDSVKATQQHFIDCLRLGRPFETSANNYLPTFVAVEAAYRSASARKRVSLSEVIGLTNS
ncbi:MAG TPA: Gfo/Idh/MocA family oxidoreductase [Bryobacteraceae bacterium]|nr:Gfo/Idh/MocA family oxidoreductase [Bryobacteraceae bacterium]